MPGSPQTIDELGVQGCLALCALLEAQSRRAPVSPTEKMTLSLMGVLRDHGIIETPWPQKQWSLDPTADTTPIESFQWRFSWESHIREGLEGFLEEFLGEVERDDFGLAVRQRFWFDLGAAESENFFEAQLSKHRFNPEWAQDLGFVIREARYMMSIAQWRYCCWAATRHGASLAQQMTTPDQNRVREGIFLELTKRADRVAAGDWGNCSFAPANPRPSNAASRLFLAYLAPLGPNFWTAPPTLEHLLALTTPRIGIRQA